jgi:hypothetical protein
MRQIEITRYVLDKDMQEVSRQSIGLTLPYMYQGNDGFFTANHYIESLLSVMGIKGKWNQRNLSLSGGYYSYDTDDGYVIVCAV